MFIIFFLKKFFTDGKCSNRKGFNGACNVHDWSGQFQGQQAKFKMTSVCGHVFGLDFLSKFNNWDRVDPVELFSCQTEKKVKLYVLKKKLYQFLIF